MARSRKSGPMVRMAAVVALVLLAQGCSSIKFAYNRIDWAVFYYVRGHVTLTDEQSDRLDQRLAAFQAWHCSTQLLPYARWLRAANDDIQAGRTEIAAFRSRNDELGLLWRALMAESSVALAGLLPQLTDAQVDEFFRNLERDNQRVREEQEPTLEERRQRSRRWMEEQLERWIGDLTAGQREAIRLWSEQARPTASEDRIAAREAWQQELRRVLQLRHESELLSVQLRRLFVEPSYLRPAEQVEERAVRREQTLQLLSDIGTALTPAQREHLAATSDSWARAFEELACAAAPRT